MLRKTLVALTIGLVVCVSLATSIYATTTHTPPWSDNYHYAFADGSYTRDAANPADTRQDSVGYNASAWLNRSASTVASFLQNDAVWSMYAHANRDLMQAYDGSSNSWLTKDNIKTYNLTGLKVAVFYGCNSAQGPDSNHVTNSAVTAGAGASIGFYNTVYLSGGYTTGPAYTWSKYFWESMAAGNTINTAAAYARDKFYQERGNYGGVDSYSTWGNGGQRITPAGYK